VRFFWLFYGGPRLAGSSSDLEFLGVNGVAKMEFEWRFEGRFTCLYGVLGLTMGIQGWWLR